MDVNNCLFAFLLINAFLCSQSNNLTVQAAESGSGSPSDPIPSHDFPHKFEVVSRRTLRSPPPPMVNAPLHYKSPPPSPRPPPPPCGYHPRLVVSRRTLPLPTPPTVNVPYHFKSPPPSPRPPPPPSPPSAPPSSSLWQPPI
ncbi:hypothetical protein DITRI_Ditri06bG0143900 [Diplodiscus trichospermus]